MRTTTYLLAVKFNDGDERELSEVIEDIADAEVSIISISGSNNPTTGD